MVNVQNKMCPKICIGFLFAKMYTTIKKFRICRIFYVFGSNLISLSNEIIVIWWFAAQVIFLIIIIHVEKSCETLRDTPPQYMIILSFFTYPRSKPAKA